MSVKSVVIVLALGASFAWAQAPTPGPSGQDEAARELMRYGIPPQLPTTPLDMSKLSEEEKKKLEEFMSGALPPDATFQDLVNLFLTPRPVPRDTVIFLGDGYAHPHSAMPWKMEIVKEEGDTVWLRGLPPENRESMLHRLWLMNQKQELMLLEAAGKQDEKYYLDFKADIVPPPFQDSLHLEEVVSSLPRQGRWQMSFDVADMNGDGILDLVFPPQRLGPEHPYIYLGEKGGKFSPWAAAQWTDKVRWDYGGVKAVDLDGDGDQDLVFGLHFKPQYAVYHDGHGGFGDAVTLPRPDPRLSSRAPAAADFNGDGKVDLAFMAEINYDPASSQPLKAKPTVWVVLNLGDRTWQLQGGGDLKVSGLPAQVIGDSLSAADLDGDNFPDLILGSSTTDFRKLVFLNRGGKAWDAVLEHGVLSNGYHFEVAADPMPPAGRRQLFAVFNQYQPEKDTTEVRTGLVLYPWAETGLGTRGTPLVVDAGVSNPYYRLALGDLNGDHRTDVVIGRKNGSLEVFLQAEGGEFRRDQSPELAVTASPFDLRLLDLDGDGLDDLVASFAIVEDQPGGVRVWLTRRGA